MGVGGWGGGGREEGSGRRYVDSKTCWSCYVRSFMAGLAAHDGVCWHGLTTVLQLLELTGMARLKEALETNDWESGDTDELELEGLELGAEDGFEAEAAEVEREMLEMGRAIHEAEKGIGEEDGVEEEEGGEYVQVEELESMILKMRAIRGTFSQSTQYSPMYKMQS